MKASMPGRFPRTMQEAFGPYTDDGLMPMGGTDERDRTYIRGAGAGYLVGFCWGALVVAIAAAVAWPKLSPYQPVYEKQGHQLIGWCGGPAPKSIPQGSDDTDITWYPTCP